MVFGPILFITPVSDDNDPAAALDRIDGEEGALEPRPAPLKKRVLVEQGFAKVQNVPVLQAIGP